MHTLNGEPILIRGLTPENRLTICTWLYEQQLLIKAAEYSWEKLVNLTEGVISRAPRECSGVWGYGGDSIAIWVRVGERDKPFPASLVANLNKDLLPPDLQALFTQD